MQGEGKGERGGRQDVSVGGSATRTSGWGWNLECKSSFGQVKLEVPWDSHVGMSCRQLSVSRMYIVIRKF